MRSGLIKKAGNYCIVNGMAPRTPWTKTSKNSNWKLPPFSFNASPMTEDESGV